MNKEIFKAILKNYPLGELKTFKLIPIGVSSENYELKTTSGTFFLKKHRRSAVKRVHYIEKMERFFSANGVPVICPIKTTTGKFHYIHQEDCYVIYPFMTGKSFKAGILPKDILEKMGAMLAQMHLLTKREAKEDYGDVSRYFIPEKYSSQIKNVEEFLGIVSPKKKQLPYDAIAYEGLLLKKKLITENKNAMSNLSFKTLNLGHGDYHPGNIFFDKNRFISHIFDLDMAGPIPRMFEVARSMLLTCFEHVYTEKRMLQAKTFLSSYYDLYPFSKVELAKSIDIFYFKEFSAWRERAHYLEKDLRSDSGYAKTIRGLKFLDEHRKELVEELYRHVSK